MPDRLPVHLNRQDRHSLEVPPSLETDDSFVITVENHGEAGRLHVHLDGDIADAVTIDATNFYVEANARTEIPVSVHEPGPAYGKLKIVSGYGAVTRWVDVELTEPDDAGGVEVDEDLGKPKPEPDTSEDDPTAGTLFSDRPALPVLGLGVVALIVAAGAAAFFQSPVVAAGALVVLVAVLAAGYLVVQ